MDNIHHIPNQAAATISPAAPPAIGPQPVEPKPEERKPLKPLRGLLWWIISLAITMLVLNVITDIPDVLHSKQVWAPSDNETIIAWAHASNNEDWVQYIEEFRPGFIKDKRSQAEKEYDEEAFCRVVFAAPKLWMEEGYDELDDEEKEAVEEYPDKISEEASTLAFFWSAMQFQLLAFALVPCLLAGGILTMVLLYRMVYNARILDAGKNRNHASPLWAALSFLVPFACLFVPVREFARAWSSLATACGTKANGLILGIWWAALIASGLAEQVILKGIIRGQIPPHEYTLISDAVDLIFYTICILFFLSLLRSTRTLKCR